METSTAPPTQAIISPEGMEPSETPVLDLQSIPINYIPSSSVQVESQETTPSKRPPPTVMDPENDHLNEDKSATPTASAKEPSLYEMRHTGSKGQGIFATQDIKKGTRIMSEPPLLLCAIPRCTQRSTMLEIMVLYDVFSKASPEEQETFRSLYFSLWDYFHKLRRITEEWAKVVELSKDKEPEKKLPCEIETLAALRSIWNMNSFEIGSKQTYDQRVVDNYWNSPFATKDRPLQSTTTTMTTAVFENICRINHSCIPNADYCYNRTLGTDSTEGHMTVQAVRDIAAGEEITLCYIEFPLSRRKRQLALMNWGFSCSCKACDLSTPFGKASNQRRRRMEAIKSNILEHHAVAAEAVEFLQLMEEEGLCSYDLYHIYIQAIRYHRAIGNQKDAYETAAKLRDMVETCAGLDHQVYQRAHCEVRRAEVMLSGQQEEEKRAAKRVKLSDKDREEMAERERKRKHTLVEEVEKKMLGDDDDDDNDDDDNVSIITAATVGTVTTPMERVEGKAIEGEKQTVTTELVMTERGRQLIRAEVNMIMGKMALQWS